MLPVTNTSGGGKLTISQEYLEDAKNGGWGIRYYSEYITDKERGVDLIKRLMFQDMGHHGMRILAFAK